MFIYTCITYMFIYYNRLQNSPVEIEWRRTASA